MTWPLPPQPSLTGRRARFLAVVILALLIPLTVVAQPKPGNIKVSPRTVPGKTPVKKTTGDANPGEEEENQKEEKATDKKNGGDEARSREARKNARKNARKTQKPSKKLDPRKAAFIKVETAFREATVTINGKPYPVNSNVGAAVAPGKVYKVLIKHNTSDKEASYKLKLRPKETRIIISDISGGSTVPVTSSRQTNRRQEQRVEQQKNESAQESGNGFLTVNATPTAQVYVDGKLVASKTPLVKHKVAPGNHTVRVYYVEQKKFSETKRAMITEGRHINLYFQSQDQ